MVIIRKFDGPVDDEGIARFKEQMKKAVGDKFNEVNWKQSVDASLKLNNSMHLMEQKAKIYMGMNIVDILEDVEGAMWATLLIEVKGDEEKANALVKEALEIATRDSTREIKDSLEMMVKAYLAFKCFVIIGEVSKSING